MARVTRSQSREQEAPKYQSDGLKSTGYQKTSANRLSTVAESPQTPGRKAPVPIVPESPGNQEGNSALSGTTVHHVSDSEEEPEDDPEALDMLDELPDLQQAAGSLLDLLISSNSDPISIFNAAKRIRDTDAKRVKRHSKKLLERMKVYTRQTFIDVPDLKSQIPGVLTKEGIHSWGPSPALHLSNCARLALDILLENAGSTATLQAIHSLNTQFPAPFMDEVTDGTRSMAIGTSATEKSTFELALEIRTQFFIMELERRQTQPGFDPKSLLMDVFYNDRRPEHLALDALRGFNLAGAFKDENGFLPDRFQDAVAERIRELEVEIFDDDDALNIKGLRAAFSWKRFVLRTANFIHQREREIRRDLQTQASFDEVKTSVSREIKRRDDPHWIDPTEQRESVAPSSAPRSSRPPLAPSSRATSRQQSIARTPERGERERAAMPHSSATPQKSLDLDNHDMPPPRTPVFNASPRRPVRGTEGSSRQRSTASMPESRSETTAVSHASPVQNSIERGSPVTSPRKPPVEKSRRRKSKFNNPRSISAVLNLSHLESQHEGQASGAPDAHVATSPSNAQGVSEIPDEIPQTQDTTTVDSGDGDGPSGEQAEWLPELPYTGDLSSPVQPRNDRVRQTPPSAPRQDQEAVSEAQDASQDIDDNQSRTAQPAPAGHRTLYDRQSGARRISPIGDSQTPGSEKVSKSAEAPSRKRPREESEESEESEDGFHYVSSDSSDIASQRAKKPKQNPKQKPEQKPEQKRRVRQRVDDRLESGSTSNEPNNQLQSSLDETTEPATRDASVPDQPPAQPTTPPSWDEHHAPRPVQPGRVRGGRGWWTEERSQRLVDLIAVHGTKWRAIADDDAEYPASKGGPMFTSRSSEGTKFQVAMKDRARVLKGRFKKNEEPLPTNFNLVAGPS